MGETKEEQDREPKVAYSESLYDTIALCLGRFEDLFQLGLEISEPNERDMENLCEIGMTLYENAQRHLTEMDDLIRDKLGEILIARASSMEGYKILDVALEPEKEGKAPGELGGTPEA